MDMPPGCLGPQIFLALLVGTLGYLVLHLLG